MSYKSNNSSRIRDLFGEPVEHDTIVNMIETDADLERLFSEFSDEDKLRVIHFLEGKSSLQILNDRFFQHIFRPDSAPERIESLISAVLGQKATVIGTLPREGTQITEVGSLVVMDIIVKLSDGSIVNVEMQRLGYLFPGERTSCYLADMIMRQYNAVRSERGRDFSYHDMRPIYMIVIMDRSSSEFSAVSPEYIHIRNTCYSSEAKVVNLENVTYISLDTYRRLAHNEINSELDAWLTFFSFEDREHVIELTEKYPGFIPMYREISEFRKSPSEVMGMFSEALKIMDRNTTKYMIDELKQSIVDRDQIIADKDRTIADQDRTIADKDRTIADQDSTIADKDRTIADQDRIISKEKQEKADKDRIIEKYKKMFGPLPEK